MPQAVVRDMLGRTGNGSIACPCWLLLRIGDCRFLYTERHGSARSEAIGQQAFLPISAHRHERNRAALASYPDWVRVSVIVGGFSRVIRFEINFVLAGDFLRHPEACRRACSPHLIEFEIHCRRLKISEIWNPQSTAINM